MLNRLFGKPKEQANALATLDKLNEVTFSNLVFFNMFLRIWEIFYAMGGMGRRLSGHELPLFIDEIVRG